MERSQPLFPSPSRSAPPVLDGHIVVELSNNPVSYHIAQCFLGVVDPEQGRELARSSCRIACMAVDVARGRLPSNRLQRAATSQCIDRLGTMTQLLGRTRTSADDPDGQMGRLPAIPRSVNGMMLSPARVEMTVHLMIGMSHHWVNLIMQYMGSRWLCVMVDIG